MFPLIYTTLIPGNTADEDFDITSQLTHAASDEHVDNSVQLQARLFLGAVGPIGKIAKQSINDIIRMPTKRLVVPCEHLEDFEVLFL